MEAPDEEIQLPVTDVAGPLENIQLQQQEKQFSALHITQVVPNRSGLDGCLFLANGVGLKREEPPSRICLTDQGAAVSNEAQQTYDMHKIDQIIETVEHQSRLVTRQIEERFYKY